MSTGETLAVVSPAGSRVDVLPRKGIFRDIFQLELAHAEPGSLEARRAAVALARQHGAEWVIVLSQSEALTEDALELAAPALGLYEAVFGSVVEEGGEGEVSRLSRLAFDQPERLPHALLNWWMPNAHLVRTALAEKVLDRVAQAHSDEWKLGYLFELWACARCLKSAQPMLTLSSSPRPLDERGRDKVLAHLETQPVFLSVVHGDAVYELPYTGRNAGIEREQSRGLFFEAMELEELRKDVPVGARVVDVGANTGNHTIFFAGPMKAASVIPFEPLPAASAALCAAVKQNGLGNVDLSFLGTGLSDGPGRAKLVFSGRGGLGATSLSPDTDGEVRIDSLDALIEGRDVDLLKIDVEGMEMAVLAGAAKLIRRSRPLIFIEIANRNTTALLDWLKSADYRIARIFSDKGHANYLLAPVTRPSD